MATKKPVVATAPGCMLPKTLDSWDKRGISPETHSMEKKLDGFRLLVVVGDDGYSRARRPQRCREMIPHIWKDLQHLPPGTILDGELTTADDDFIHVGSVMKSLPPRARELQGVDLHGGAPLISLPRWDAKPLKYAVFDVQRSGLDQDLTGLPWWSRRMSLHELMEFELDEELEHSFVTESYEADQDKIARWIESGHEGAIIKRNAGPYVCGRPLGEWWRVKLKLTADVVVTGFSPGREGKGVKRMTDTIGAIVFGQYRDGELVRRGQCSGISDELRFYILDRAAGVDRRPEFMGKVFEISHRGIQTKTFRQPQFERWRDDKLPEECEWDT